MGWDYQAKLEQHESQTDHTKGFGGKYGVQKDRQDKVYQHVNISCAHSPTGMLRCSQLLAGIIKHNWRSMVPRLMLVKALEANLVWTKIAKMM